jgi:DNA-binding protein H-NS
MSDFPHVIRKAEITEISSVTNGRVYGRSILTEEVFFTMASYKELLEQRRVLEEQIAEVKAREFAVVVDEIKQKMVDYGITLADLDVSTGRGKWSRGSKQPKAAVAPKYRDPVSGATWSGRGKAPKWIAGQNRDRFTV